MSTTNLFDDGTPSQKGVGAPSPEVGIVDPRLLWIVKQLSRNEPKCNEWKTRAREIYRFIGGKQLSDEDEKLLKAEKRPNNAFNTLQKYIRYVSGVQRDSYVALLFDAIDFENTNVQLFGDRLTRYYDWAMDKSRGNAERARAFEDFLGPGMGWTNTFISRAEDPRGMVGYERLPPLEMLWPDSDKVNLGQSGHGCTRWRGRESWIENEEAKALFPDEYAHFLIDNSDPDSAPSLTWPQVDRVPYIIPYVQSYPLDTLGGQKRRKKDRSKILEFQWWDNDPGYVFVDPLDQTQQYMNAAEFKEYQDQLARHFNEEIRDYDYQIGRKWLRAFVLNRRHFLEEPTELPGKRFTFNAMCCHFDEFDRIWYGFARVLMDPQRYANKFFNQVIEIMAKQAKAGAMAEVSAFEDKAQEQDFLDRYAQTGSVNFLADGGIEKIKEKQLPQFPSASMAVLDFCIKSMSEVTGISEASLGLGAATQAGVMLKRRQRAGMVLLAAEFDAESDFRKEEGSIVFDHLKLIADDRLIRVGGAYEGEILKLSQAPFGLDYDIQIDEVERDPNVRQWLAELIMGPFGQTMMRMNAFQPEFLNVLPIPRRWIEKIKQGMAAREKKMQEDMAKGLPAPGGRGQRKSLMELQAVVQNKQADTIYKKAKAKALLARAGQDDFKVRQDGVRLLLDNISRQAQERRDHQMHTVDMTRGIANAASTFAGMNNGGQPGM